MDVLVACNFADQPRQLADADQPDHGRLLHSTHPTTHWRHRALRPLALHPLEAVVVAVS